MRYVPDGSYIVLMIGADFHRLLRTPSASPKSLSLNDFRSVSSFRTGRLSGSSAYTIQQHGRKFELRSLNGRSVHYRNSGYETSASGLFIKPRRYRAYPSTASRQEAPGSSSHAEEHTARRLASHH